MLFKNVLLVEYACQICSLYLLRGSKLITKIKVFSYTHKQTDKSEYRYSRSLSRGHNISQNVSYLRRKRSFFATMLSHKSYSPENWFDLFIQNSCQLIFKFAALRVSPRFCSVQWIILSAFALESKHQFWIWPHACFKCTVGILT